MRLLILLVTLSLFAGCCGRLVNPNRPRTLAEQRDSAVQIATTCADGRGGTGSGVLLDDGHVLTAAHVVGCVEPFIQVQSADGNIRVMLVKSIDPVVDLALLEVAPGEGRFPTPPSVVFGPAPKEKERICLESGTPFRGRQCGQVYAYGNPNAAGNMAHRAITVPGNSGSGVYDEQGRLVGIVTHLINCEGGHACGGLASVLSIERLKKLLTSSESTEYGRPVSVGLRV